MELKETFEDEYDCHVLSIRDFGSKAYNLEGPNSDKDALLIFAHDPIEYAEVGTYRDSVGRENYCGYDLQAWNVQKFGGLLTGSNPTAIEFLNSPIYYYEPEHIGRELHELMAYCNEHFQPIRLYYHYRSLAENNYRKYVEDGSRATVKKNLFVIRGILYSQYVKDTMDRPSLNFPSFLEEQSTAPKSIIEGTEELIRLKQSGRGDEDVGNVFGTYVEGELGTELDDDKYDVRGIDGGVINDFIRQVC